MNGTQGWSPRVGQCTAAYVKHQDPSGSSSGSAVAASVGLAVAAIGTDTRGSIVSGDCELRVSASRMTSD